MPAESSGRLLERHGNVSPREMAVKGARAPEQNPAYRPTRSHQKTAGADRHARLLLDPLGSGRGEGCRADDAGGVAVYGDHDRRFQLQQR